MKIKLLLLSLFFLLGIQGIYAQEEQTLSLEEVAQLAIKNSNEAKISETKLGTAREELKDTKNIQYPDLSVSGQYMYLTNADIKGNLISGGGGNAEEEGSSSASPEIHQLLLGQASLGMPIFSGFKLKNTIQAQNNVYQAAVASTKNAKEEISMQAINNYIALYKAKQTVKLVKENLKSASQRVTDFTNMEENGILAKNDLLKAELQKSNVELALEEAKKNERVINYQLVRFLKLPEGTTIQIPEHSFENSARVPRLQTVNRADIEALEYQAKAAEDQIKVARAAYYPTLSLSAGYIALDLENALTVTNAMNVGVGISYNFANIFKNKSKVNIAKSRAQEAKFSLDKLNDQVSVEIKNAQEEYQLALKNLNVYQKSEEQANENYRIVKDKYDNGLQDTNDLLEADVQQLQSKINLAYAKADILQKYYELQKVQGNLVNQLNQ